MKLVGLLLVLLAYVGPTLFAMAKKRMGVDEASHAPEYAYDNEAEPDFFDAADEASHAEEVEASQPYFTYEAPDATSEAEDPFREGAATYFTYEAPDVADDAASAKPSMDEVVIAGDEAELRPHFDLRQAVIYQAVLDGCYAN